ncbi:dual specificity mitogen-activated protein kinase kinase 7-like [Varroa jacobsoni]|uniref:mitogen-activated protein kinase kinase n=1 Tax=Varroa destructor TaxID=109461 RepID=A0A7M7JXM5_VARDE|nr:dual specificity mitogen-activated protein kinase kinase 7-like [Varroa destructor]XP_022657498.1 dual specificity mitogen-activated protein kinase kinase 7-like [Varroa destructor]XP_022657509.1 dual specificity mitogen-activated protein kinase kinase 7-like [Varroa destructor]XP_022657517.1 dual specificity mitogen-activated protein kinase kinase 7-like [Varroa destructor]XP_022690227.1 dual specificity mitogen-activated protein kinase kinase 7-like [Varroa jacobsoni]XP_022690228.1 dual s
MPAITSGEDDLHRELQGLGARLEAENGGSHSFRGSRSRARPGNLPIDSGTPNGSGSLPRTNGIPSLTGGPPSAPILSSGPRAQRGHSTDFSSEELRGRPREIIVGGGPPQSYRRVQSTENRQHRDIMQNAQKLTFEDGTIFKDVDPTSLLRLEDLGTGTCGHVVKMQHVASGRVMAVKQMRKSGVPEENRRIYMDLDVVLRCTDCPHIVHCYGYFVTDSEVWICMELMTSCIEKLQRLRSHEPVPEQMLGYICVSVVKALNYLKDKHGVIHRDVKPSNILLDRNGNVKLCDFGIAGQLVESKAKTQSAGVAGYIAPERIDPERVGRNYDVRADVWSLGIALVELATGRHPYASCTTDFELLVNVLERDPPRLDEAMFSKELCDFVQLCLTKDFKNRPKYHKLMKHEFIKKYDTPEATARVAEWFRENSRRPTC